MSSFLKIISKKILLRTQLDILGSNLITSAGCVCSHPFLVVWVLWCWKMQAGMLNESWSTTTPFIVPYCVDVSSGMKIKQNPKDRKSRYASANSSSILFYQTSGSGNKGVYIYTSTSPNTCSTDDKSSFPLFSLSSQLHSHTRFPYCDIIYFTI